MTENAPQTGYAPINGLEMYYEIHGSGEPLLLLHGAYGAIDMWESILQSLAQGRQVIAVEFQGHGHTAEIDRPFSFEQFANDIAAVMEYLGIAQADIVGYSLGGNTGLQLAIRRPDLVRKLVAISPNHRPDGYYLEILAMILTITPEVLAGSPMEVAYLRNAPNPGDSRKLVEKLKQLNAQDFAWPEEGLESIVAPVLLVIGDSDVVRPERAVELFRLLGGGVPGDLTGLPDSQLAVLPEKTHVSLIMEPTDLLLAMMSRFLAAPAPEAA